MYTIFKCYNIYVKLHTATILMDYKNLKENILGLLVTSDTQTIWDINKLKTTLENKNTTIVKRTLERKLSAIPWLECSKNPEDQLDEYGNVSTQSVFNYFILEARKKRHSTLFINIHQCNQGSKEKPIYIIVSEDGKGAKRWSFLKTINNKNLILSLSLIAGTKPTIFFPSGKLVQYCKNIKKDNELIDSHFNIFIGHFLSPNINIFDNTIYNQSDKTLKNKIINNSSELSHMDRLEAESIFILREVVAEADNPVMLYSMGKDSAVMLHLAKKAFYPSPPPFPLMHVDTRWKFKSMYEFRDEIADAMDMDLIVHVNPEGIEKNINPFDHGSALHTDIMKTQGLKQALNMHQFDVAFGGARRDEEKSRAKERIFSFRSINQQWDPKNQRPELWNIYNCKKSPGESIRVFPLSNWTELDIWQYIYRENIPIVPLYFAKERPLVLRNGSLIMIDDDRIKLLPDEIIKMKKVRFRTLGCYPLTGAVESSAENLSDIILEILKSNSSERQGRTIDSDSDSSMEKKKKEGYF